MLVLRNANVASLCRLFFTMSNLRKAYVTRHYIFKPMSYVTRVNITLSNFKRRHVALSISGLKPHKDLRHLICCIIIYVRLRKKTLFMYNSIVTLLQKIVTCVALKVQSHHGKHNSNF